MKVWSLCGSLMVVGTLMLVGCGSKLNPEVAETATWKANVVPSIEFETGLSSVGGDVAKNCFQWVTYTGSEKLEISNKACPASGVAARADVKVVLNVTAGATNESTVYGTDSSTAYGKFSRSTSNVVTFNALCEAASVADAGTFGSHCSLTIDSGSISKVNPK